MSLTVKLLTCKIAYLRLILLVLWTYTMDYEWSFCLFDELTAFTNFLCIQ